MIRIYLLLSVLLANGLSPITLIADTMPPHELIVRFVAGSETRQTTIDTMKTGVSKTQALETLIESLSKQVGVPLTIRQVTSGQEVVLAVDTEDQLIEVIKRLRQRPDVEYVQANMLLQPLKGHE